MSDISEKVRVALYAKMNVVAVVGSGKASAIYYQNAPEQATKPYIVFDRVAPGPVTRVVLGGQILEDDLWQIKCVVDEDSSTTKEPQELAQDILSLAETAINETLTISGNTVEFVKRVSDIPGLRELVNGRYIYSEGFNLRVQTS
jgi:hypothetical protein